MKPGIVGAFDPGRLPIVGEIAARLSLLLSYALLVFACRSAAFYIAGPDPDFILLLGIQGAVLTLIVGLAWVPVHSRGGKLGFRRAAWALPASAFVLLPFCAVILFGGVESTAPGTGWFVGLGMLLLAAAAEEIEFRGFLLDALAFRGFMPASVAVSSALFALVHTDNPGSSPLALVNIGLFGAVLCEVRFLTRGIAAPILLHWLWNSVTGMVLGANVSGLEIPTVLRPAGELPWGAFGPEESPALTILLGAMSLLGIWILVRGDRARKRAAAAVSGVPAATHAGPA